MRTQAAAALRLGIVCAAAFGFVVSTTLAAQQKSAVRDRQVYATIKELMESIIDPSADAVWGAVRTVVDGEGTHETVPRTADEWLDVRHAAVRIVEGSNLLMMPGRDAAPPGTKSEAPGVELEPPQITALIKKNRRSFNAFAKALQGVALDALRASDSKNTESLLEIGARMEEVCESCHQTFWYPAQKRASPRNSGLTGR